MKVFKKVLIGALSAAMLLGSVLTVSADDIKVPSVAATTNMPTKAVNADNEKQTYWISPVYEGYLEWELREDGSQADADAIAAANNKKSVADFITEINKSKTEGAADVAKALEGKEWLTTFFEIEVGYDDNYDRSKTHNVDVKLTVPGISKYSKDQLTFVHYNVTDGKWETLEIKSIGSDDTVVVHFDHFSPSAIAFATKTAAATTTAATTTTAAATTSPKTGVATNWAGYAMAAALLAVCSVLFSRKRRA